MGPAARLCYARAPPRPCRRSSAARGQATRGGNVTHHERQRRHGEQPRQQDGQRGRRALGEGGVHGGQVGGCPGEVPVCGRAGRQGLACDRGLLRCQARGRRPPARHGGLRTGAAASGRAVGARGGGGDRRRGAGRDTVRAVTGGANGGGLRRGAGRVAAGFTGCRRERTRLVVSYRVQTSVFSQGEGWPADAIPRNGCRLTRCVADVRHCPHGDGVRCRRVVRGESCISYLKTLRAAVACAPLSCGQLECSCSCCAGVRAAE